MAMSAEHRSKFVALHRLCEKFRVERKIPYKQTNKQTKYFLELLSDPLHWSKINAHAQMIERWVVDASKGSGLYNLESLIYF